MKKYIFLEGSIYPIGGVQAYIAAKISCLKKMGWKVSVIYDGKCGGQCALPELDEYNNGGIRGLLIPPGSLFNSIEKKIVGEMLSIVGTDKCDSIIIESGASSVAMWGELLAKELNAKHICYVLNEGFRAPYFYYTENFDFFDFKHKRRELVGIANDSIIKLFEGYKTVPPEESYRIVPVYIDDVQDIENDAVNGMQRLDWNICYLGRIEKPYVKRIIDDLGTLAQAHPDKKIQIIFVGKADIMRNYINKKFENLNNASLTFLDDLIPIPKKLFEKVDVVIAGSGCAVAAAYSGALTIIPDPINNLANGVFGYDTFQTVYHEPGTHQMEFNKAVERVLVEKAYEGRQVKLPYRRTRDDYIDDFFKFVEQSADIKEYFVNFQNRTKGVILKRSLKYFAKRYFPFTVYIKQWLKKYFIH